MADQGSVVAGTVRSTGRGLRWSLGVLGYLSLLATLTLASRRGDPGTLGLVTAAVLGLTLLVAVAAALRTATDPGLDRRSRWAWGSLAGVFLLSLGAGTTLGLAVARAWDGGTPVSVGLGLRTLTFPLLVMALLLLPGAPTTSEQRRRFWLDLATVGGGAFMVCWYLLFGRDVRPEGLDRLAVVFPALDLVTVFMVCAVLRRVADTRLRRPLGVLVGGLVLCLVDDVWICYLVVSDGLTLGDTVPLACVLVFATSAYLMAVASVLQRRRGRGRTPPVRRGWGLATSVLPYASLLGGYLVLGLAARAEPGLWGGLVAGVLLLTSAATARHLLALREVKRLGTTDSLTSLANRRSLTDHLTGTLARAEGSRVAVAVLSLDLDRFRRLNEQYGHDTGDEVLLAVSAALQGCLRQTDRAARVGGDEFVVVLSGVRRPQQAIGVAERVLRALAEPIIIDELSLLVRASIGVALADQDGASTSEELLRQASLARCAAKRMGGHRWELYAASLEGTDDSENTLEDDLREALIKETLHVQYQPIVDLASGEVVAAEALVRWTHPRYGPIAPPDFIPMAEATGLIHELGAWVLEEASRAASRWQSVVPSGHRLDLSVNLSPVQLSRPGLAEEVQRILEATGLDPSSLVLEVTESSVVNNEAAVPQLHALRERGIRIALDDFGTGYSSLQYLTRLPVDILKLDRCFVADLNGGPEGAAVAEAVIRLAKILHLDTVAEGVEQVEQVRELALLGCRTAQGYHFARPLSPGDFEELIGSGSGWPSLDDQVPAPTPSQGA